MKELYRRVECSWCKIVMRPAQDEGVEVSHSCCCACKAKYFPTLGDATECRMEMIDRQHEGCGVDASPREEVCHVDTFECSVCKRIKKPEPEACDCAEVDQNSFPEHD